MLLWLLCALPVSAQTNPADIGVFISGAYKIDELSSRRSNDMIDLEIRITNMGTNPIPDLRHEHLAKYSKFYIDGRPTQLFGMFNGNGSHRTNDTLSQGESDTNSWAQVMIIPDTNLLIYTVQWEYMGSRSGILEANRIDKTVKEKPLISIAEQSVPGYVAQGAPSPEP